MALLAARRGLLAASIADTPPPPPPPPPPGEYFAEVMDDNPIGLWKVDETAGTSAADASGFGRDATYEGSGFTLNRVGPSSEIPAAVRLTTGSNQVRTPLLSAFDIPSGGTWSAECWFRVNLGETGARGVMSWRGDGSDRLTVAVLVNSPAAGNVSAFLVDPSNSFVSIQATDQAYNDDRWHHVVVTSVADGDATLYIDGVAKGSTGTGRDVTSQNRRIRMGSNQDNQYLPGKVAAGAVYDTALSLARVEAHYSAGRFVEDLPVALDAVAGWWAADTIDGLADTDPVTRWIDLTAARHTLYQDIVAKQPTFRTGLQNGLPGVRFDGDFLRRGTWPTLTVPNTVVVVARAASVPSSTATMFGAAASGQGSRQVLAFDSAGMKWTMFNGTIRADGAVDTDPHLFLASFTGSSADRFRIDAADTGIAASAGTRTLTQNVTVGSDATDAQPWPGDVFEAILIDDELSTTDRDALEAHLMTKYDL
jgi:hypothetical protein